MWSIVYLVKQFNSKNDEKSECLTHGFIYFNIFMQSYMLYELILT